MATKKGGKLAGGGSGSKLGKVKGGKKRPSTKLSGGGSGAKLGNRGSKKR